MTIGETIHSLRTSHNLSQQSFAEALSVSRELVSKWENGTRRPDFRTIERIAGLFEVPVETLADRTLLLCQELADCFSIAAAVPGKDLTDLLNSFLHSRKALHASIFLKRYYFQKSISEISSEYGIGENHVRSILSKTRKKLKIYLEEAHGQ